MTAASLLGRHALAAALAMLVTCQGATAAPLALAPSSNPQTAIAAAVAEASRRFGVPPTWIWQIIRVESGGNVAAVSSAGAMGLMQIMPATYAELRRRYGLGADPFVVRDNVLAGTAYLRELHDRYGVDGMLAAYNAGPGRWEDHLRTGRPLPGETRRYLAQLLRAIAPGATDVSSSPLVTSPPSPFTAPLFVGRTAVAPPSSLRAAYAQPTADEPSRDSVPTAATTLLATTPSGSGAAIMLPTPSSHPRSSALFVTASPPRSSQ